MGSSSGPFQGGKRAAGSALASGGGSLGSYRLWLHRPDKGRVLTKDLGLLTRVL